MPAVPGTLFSNFLLLLHDSHKNGIMEFYSFEPVRRALLHIRTIMKKKQARYGKSGGQPSTSPSYSPSDKIPASKSAADHPKSSRPRRRPPIHENFEWGFVSGGDQSDFDEQTPQRNSAVSATSKKQVAKKTVTKKTVVKKERAESGPNKGPNKGPKSPQGRKGTSQTVPGQKKPPSTLFQPEDWDEDLALPSYGRTMLHTASPQSTSNMKIVPEPLQKERTDSSRPTPSSRREKERDRTKRPVKDSPAPPKKIVAKPVDREEPERKAEYKVERKERTIPNKATEKAAQVKPKEDVSPSRQDDQQKADHRADHKKKKHFDPRYAIPPLPPRERLRWDPEKREYVRDQLPSDEKKTTPASAPTGDLTDAPAEKKKDFPKEQRPRTGKEKKGVSQERKPVIPESAPTKQPAKQPPRRAHSSPKPERLTDSVDTNAEMIADVETGISSGFKKLPISETMLEALKVVRYLEPTPIQAGVIPSVMKGIDVLGQAQTGTGKTAAFLIPLIEGIEECEAGNSPVALILVPTRELAVQVRDEAVKLSYGRDVRVTACYGGKPIAKNLLRLREGVDIIIGTPGRLLDLMKRGALSCNMLRWVVLDEADRMLDIGFRPDIEKILARTPSDRQTLLFSATLPPQVIKLATKYMIDPQVLDFSTRVAVETIEQFYITVDQMRKFDALVQLLRQEEPNQAIIFCRTKRGADRVGRMLESQFASLATIHGDLAQPVRDKVMSQFRAGTLRYLVATDVVGRGIDVSGISHIINYDIPKFCDDYVHRVGRTGRMGRDGVAFTFVTAEEGSELTRIEMRIDRLLNRAELKDFEAFAKPTDSTIVDPFGPPQGKPVFGKPVRKVRRAL